mgnify:CR=1 FL=1
MTKHLTNKLVPILSLLFLALTATAQIHHPQNKTYMKSNTWKSQTNLTPLAKKNLPTLFIIRLPL